MYNNAYILTILKSLKIKNKNKIKPNNNFKNNYLK